MTAEHVKHAKDAMERMARARNNGNTKAATLALNEAITYAACAKADGTPVPAALRAALGDASAWDLSRPGR